MDLWRNSADIKCLVSVHAPLLSTVAIISRCPDTFASVCALSGSRRICGGTVWRLNLGECTFLSIPLSIPVATKSRAGIIHASFSCP